MNPVTPFHKPEETTQTPLLLGCHSVSRLIKVPPDAEPHLVTLPSLVFNKKELSLVVTNLQQLVRVTPILFPLQHLRTCLRPH